ncbi:MAG: protein kinase [Planctomycetota bacterium]
MSDFGELRRIVEEALDRPVDQREAWLADRCEGTLHARALELVRAAATDESFLEPIYSVPTPPAEGQQLGPYTLRRPLASGGMGTVFLAERTAPHREVALKVMRAGLPTAESVARFRFEVEVLATLTHPHIAPMYETGMHGELPWFAMEYVRDAQSMTAYATTRHLGPTERIELFLQACDAIHHGHTKGVLHRDIKPDNLLVDDAGRCKVIDFGIARATDADLGRTLTGELLGTIAYMSPEQVAGLREGLDTRSDVYALGVVLYELLAGDLPYPVRDALPYDAMDAIRRTPPARTPALRGDLQTIVFKCLEKEPAQRYDSAAALAADLRRYLGHETIAARAPSVTYQLKTFARRNRLLVGATAAIVVVSLAAAVASSLWARRAEEAATSASSARAQAEKSAEEARQLFENVLGRSVDALERDTMRIKMLAGGGPVAAEMIRLAIEDLKVLASLAPKDDKVARQLVHAHLLYGGILGDPAMATNSGDRASAKQAYEEALRRARALEDARYLEGLALSKLARLEKSKEQLEEAISILASLPDEFRMLRQQAYSHEALAGWALDDDGNLKAARRHFGMMQDLLERAAAMRPDASSVRFDLARTKTQLGSLAAASGDFSGADALLAEASTRWDALVEADPDDLHLRVNRARCLINVGRVRDQRRDLPGAATALQQASQDFRELRRDDPESGSHAAGHGAALFFLGHVLSKQADAASGTAQLAHLRDARDAFREAWTITVELEKRGRRGPAPSAHLQKKYAALERRVGSG